ncbi:MAG: hypothetical protein RIS86_119 [Planctomycetota bacterium]|jgi:hypothetical protein
MKTSETGLLPRLVLAALAASALALAGCNIVTPVAYAIEGPGQIDAEYTLADKKTVVFVDDPRNILTRTALRASIGDAVGAVLYDRELVSTLVNTRDAIAISRQGVSGTVDGPTGGEMSMQAIARALDCAQMVWIRPYTWDVVGRSDTQGIRPTAQAYVRVLDFDARARVYPSPEVLPRGREVTAIIRETDPNLLRTRATRTQVEDQLAAKLSAEVAKLFYKHDRIDLGENLGTRRR